MSFYSPKKIVGIVNNAAIGKSEMNVPKTLALAFLAGAYIAVGGLLAVVVGGGVPGIAAENPGIQKFLMGAVFPVGLMLTVIAGADLFTGNTAYFIPPIMSGKLRVFHLVRNWTLVYIGNFIGSLFVAYVLTKQSGILDASPWNDMILNIAQTKTSASFGTVVAKGIGANWLVALGVWLAFSSKEIVGKIFGIWFPVMAFVAIGYEHSVANMFFIPTAIFYGSPVTWTEFIVNNLIPATIGNIIGGSILVGGFYWYVYGERRTNKK